MTKGKNLHILIKCPIENLNNKYDVSKIPNKIERNLSKVESESIQRDCKFKDKLKDGNSRELFDKALSSNKLNMKEENSINLKIKLAKTDPKKVSTKVLNNINSIYISRKNSHQKGIIYIY